MSMSVKKSRSSAAKTAPVTGESASQAKGVAKKGKAAKEQALESAKTKMPLALVKRAEAAAKQKRDELLARAREEIAFVLEKQHEIVAAFYDIGAALNRLNDLQAAELFGYGGFGEMIEKEMGFSVQKARDLMAIAKYVRREDALRWGQEKSAALVELAQATAAPDSPASLARKPKLKIAKGRVIDVEKVNAATLRQVAREVRAERGKGAGPKRGVTTTPEEQSAASRLQEALRAFGAERGRVTAVARAGSGADLRIERVPVSALDLLAKAALRANKAR